MNRDCGLQAADRRAKARRYTVQVIYRGFMKTGLT